MCVLDCSPAVSINSSNYVYRLEPWSFSHYNTFTECYMLYKHETQHNQLTNSMKHCSWEAWSRDSSTFMKWEDSLVFTRACYRSMFLGSWILSTPLHHMAVFSHLCFDLPFRLKSKAVPLLPCRWQGGEVL
jgi:hypothetical protein